MIPTIAFQPIFVNSPAEPRRSHVASRGLGLSGTLLACALAFGFVVHGSTRQSQARLEAFHVATLAEKAEALREFARSMAWEEPAYPAPRDPRFSREAVLAGLEATGVDVEQELNCLALNIYFEALREPVVGQRAVAHVVMNRVADRRFPASACQVIQQGGERVRHRCQFSWWCDGRSDRPKNPRLWQAMKALAQDVYLGRSADPTSGALWYHADYVSPYWGKVFKKGPKIGRHIFYVADEKAVLIASRQ
jgi:hypothetical protein